jgi:hypothetical protein
MNRRRTVPREAAASPAPAEHEVPGPRPSSQAPSRVRPTSQAIGLVRVRTPWFAPKFVVRAKCRAAVPEYEAIAALDEKLYVLTEDGRFGGIYVWRSRVDAEAYYSPAWRQGVRQRRGVDPQVDLFDATAVVEGSTRIEGAALGERSLAYPAWATLRLWRAAAAPALAESLGEREGMVRAFIVTQPERIGFVALWSSRALAVAASGRSELGRFGAPEVSDGFETPVFMDAPRHRS